MVPAGHLGKLAIQMLGVGRSITLCQPPPASLRHANHSTIAEIVGRYYAQHSSNTYLIHTTIEEAKGRVASVQYELFGAPIVCLLWILMVRQKNGAHVVSVSRYRWIEMRRECDGDVFVVESMSFCKQPRKFPDVYVLNEQAKSELGVRQRQAVNEKKD